MASIEQKFLGGQFGMARGIVQKGRAIDNLAKGARRMNIDLNDARVWRDLQHPQAGIVWRRITFQNDLPIQFGRRLLDRRQEIQVVLKMGQRRHKNIEMRLSHLDAKRRSQQAVRGLERGRRLFGLVRDRICVAICVPISVHTCARSTGVFVRLMPQRHLARSQVPMRCCVWQRRPWRHGVRRQIGYILG